MEILPQLVSLKDVVRVSFVYIAEAHAENEWPVGNRYRKDHDSMLWTPAWKASTSDVERLERAEYVARRFQLPSHVRLYADPVQTTTTNTNTIMPSMSDDQNEKQQQPTFESVMGGWPTGFYVGVNGCLSYVVRQKRGIFDLDEMWHHIGSLLKSRV